MNTKIFAIIFFTLFTSLTHAQNTIDGLTAAQNALLIQAERNAILNEHLELERDAARDARRERDAQEWREFNAESERMRAESNARSEAITRESQERMQHLREMYRDRR